VLVQELITHEVTSVAAGAAHCVAVTAQEQTFVWGRGDSGQVGSYFFVYYARSFLQTNFSLPKLIQTIHPPLDKSQHSLNGWWPYCTSSIGKISQFNNFYLLAWFRSFKVKGHYDAYATEEYSCQ
jgi:hypothetical protein